MPWFKSQSRDRGVAQFFLGPRRPIAPEQFHYPSLGGVRCRGDRFSCLWLG